MAIDQTTSQGLSSNIVQQALSFSQLWSNVFEELPRYQLDFTWPSVTTLGMITEIVRYNKNGAIPEEFLTGAAAYLSVMTAAAWQVFPVGGGRYFVKSDEKSNAVVASTVDENGAKKILGRIQMVEALTKFYNDSQSPSYFPLTLLDRLPMFSPLRRFALEIFSGLSPFCEGEWKTQTMESLRPNLISLDLSLAKGTASYCEQVYPSDQKLHLSELYTGGILTPPIGFNEPTMVGRAATALGRNVLALATDDEEKRAILSSLTSINEPQLATAALVTLTALDLDGPADHIKRFNRTSYFLGSQRQILKPAIELGRKYLEKPAIVELAIKKDVGATATILKQESAIGLLPPFEVTAEALLSVNGLLLAYYLCNDSLIYSVIAKQKEASDVPQTIELLQIQSAINLRDLDSAKLLLGSFRARHTSIIDAAGDAGAYFYRLLADIVRSEGDFEEAAGLYSDATAKVDPTNTKLLSALLTDQAECLAALDAKTEALECVEEAIRIDPWNLSALELSVTLNQTRTPVSLIIRKLPFSIITMRSLINEKLAEN